MKIASWNVNSVRARLPRLLAWLGRERPDVVCLQETKVVDDDFPAADLENLGYHCTVHGQKTYNGVAVLSLEPAKNVVRGFPDGLPEPESRALAVTVAGIRVASLYVPNGKDAAHPAYQLKLTWLERLRQWLDGTFDAACDVALCGDFNIAPTDADVWNVEQWRGQNLFSEPEKERFRSLLEWGLVDALGDLHSGAGTFTWWDYRMGAFHRGWGLRIDHILLSRSLAARCTAVAVQRDERKGDKPSDHVPVVATFAPTPRSN